MSQNIALIGECMLELQQPPGTHPGRSVPMTLSYGGDTLNCAVYLARQDISVDYVTALGNDSMSDWLMQQWRDEGVGCKLVDRYPDSVPGLYMVELDEHGERSFLYWRDSSPARRLFDDPGRANRLFEKLSNYEWLCLSGITLAIYSEEARGRLFDFLGAYRNGGGKVVFDGNYRPKLWPCKETTQAAYEAMYRLTDIALPTDEDEEMLFGDADQDAIISRLQSWGVGEVVLKRGEDGCLVVTGSDKELVASNTVEVVDTTSAGDSFNAGYLAARVKGAAPRDAAKNGHRLASVVIQHRGAIIPAEAMPEGL